MSGEVIREFLVKLAYSIDQRSQTSFVETVAGSTKLVVGFAAAASAAAVGVVASTAKMAAGLESVYFASRRVGAESERLMALSHAARQAGVGVEGVQGSLEGMARFLRYNPGGEGFLKNLGVQTRDAQGKLRDTTDLLLSFNRQTQNMPLHQAQAYANVLGIDEQTLLALRSGELQRGMAEYAGLVAKSGVNMGRATEDSRAFMHELRILGSVFDILQAAATSALVRTIGPHLRSFREFLLANSGRIASAIGEIGDATVKAGRFFADMAVAAYKSVSDIIATYSGLDNSTKEAIKTVGLLLAAFLAINSAALATPIGAIAALAGALVFLHSDFQKWKDGSGSLIDWGSWSKELGEARAGISDLASALNDVLGGAIGEFAGNTSERLKNAFAGAFTDPISNTVRELKTLIDTLTDLAHLLAAVARGDWNEVLERTMSLNRTLAGGESAFTRLGT